MHQGLGDGESGGIFLEGLQKSCEKRLALKERWFARECCRDCLLERTIVRSYDT
jgi:hypothetical protein